MKFNIYNGDLIGLPTNNNHAVFRWQDKDCKILFSATRQGNAISCHLASDKRGLRKLKQACKDWIEFVFSFYDWCEVIIAKTIKPSIERFISKLRFKLIANSDKYNVFIYQREQLWDL